jgi:hypothetical protein
MVTTHACEAESVAETLSQLADLVEHSGLTASDIGDYLASMVSVHSCAEGRQELKQLRGSTTSTADFARGLRRQAAELRVRARS